MLSALEYCVSYVLLKTLNDHKYQSVPTNPASADVEKRNLTVKRLSELEGKVRAALSEGLNGVNRQPSNGNIRELKH